MKTDPAARLTTTSYALEIHIAQHCNLSCHGCAQSSPLMQRDFELLGTLRAALCNLSEHLEATKLQVIGGEPLLHPEVDEILWLAKSSGIASTIAVKTNGVLLPRMSDRFWKFADEVIVSVYPSTAKRLERGRSQSEQRASAAGTKLEYRVFDKFRHIMVPGLSLSAARTRHVFERCEFKKFTHSLRNGRLYRCAPSVNAEHKSDTSNSGSIDVLDTQNLGARIAELLSSDSPLSSCRSCLGSSGASFPHLMGVNRLTALK